LVVSARAAWYYFVGGLTQQEIADRLGLTRLRVNKLIAQARTDGSVRIEIRTPLADCVELEDRIARRYGLADCAIVPSVPDNADQQRVVGHAAAVMLDRYLEDGQAIGVGWGRTLRAGLARLSSRRHARSWVVALMGGLTRGSGTNTFEVSTELARLIGAECYYLSAPIYCPDESSRQMLLTHLGLSEVMRRAREVDVAVVSCGDVTDRSELAATISVQESVPELLRAGAVGDLLGTYLDARGAPVDHSLNRRVMAVSPAELKAVRVSILASGGAHKTAVIRAILNAGYVNRLVTDTTVARALL
jgi:DNA-binding transcriptional regulator LsrR (DeoR family)